MTDKNLECDFSPEDEALWAIFAAINQERTRAKFSDGAEEEIRRLRRAMLLSPPIGCSRPTRKWARTKARVMRLRGRSAGIEAHIAWLRETRAFDEEDLNRVRRAKLFYEDTTGAVLMRARGLDLATANAVIATIAFTAGIWVGQVIFTDRVGIQMVANSYAVGSVLGFVAGRVLDRSFRFQQIREKVLSVAPWLTRSESVTQSKEAPENCSQRLTKRT